MNVLILGAGGFIGTSVAGALRNQNVQPISAARTPKRGDSNPAERWVKLDRRDVTDVIDTVRRARIDTVIDMIAFSASELIPLLPALRGNIGRYVLISSCDVYQHYGLLQGMEKAPVTMAPLTESAPLRTRLFPYRRARSRATTDRDHWMDDYEKIAVEAALRLSGLPYTILRLPMVFGPNDAQRRFEWILSPMKKDADIKAPMDWLDWVTSYDHVVNVASAIALASLHSRANNETYNVSTFNEVAHSVWLERCRTITGWRGSMIADRSPQNPIAKATAALDLKVPLRLSDAKLRTQLEFRPAIDETEALMSLMQESRFQSH